MKGRARLISIRCLILICAAVLVLPVEAAGGDRKPRVVTSIPLLRNLAALIGGNEAEVASIVKGSSCCHEYEPSAGEMRRVASCDLFILAGLDFDPWAERIAPSGGGTRVLDASRGINSCREGQGNGTPNPHYWWDPGNVRIVAGNIADALSKVRPAKKAYFAANRLAFEHALAGTAARLKAETAALRDRRIVSYAAAFPYLYRYFGFENVLTVQDVCEEQEISPKRLARAVEIIRKNGIKAVVGEAVEPKGPAALAREAGVKTVLLWPTTNESGEYLETLTDNVHRLAAALR